MSEVIKVNIQTNLPKIRINEGHRNRIEHVIREDENNMQMNLKKFYEQGLNEGKKQTKQELEKYFIASFSKKVDQFNAVLTELDGEISGYDKIFEKLVIELAFIISEKILQTEISNKSIIKETLKKALNKVISTSNVNVKLNPIDYEDINNNEIDFLNKSSLSKIKFQSDPSIEGGGCYIETELGNIDATLSTQVSELKKRFEESLQEL